MKRRYLTTKAGNESDVCLSDEALSDPDFMRAYDELIDAATKQMRAEHSPTQKERD